MLLRSTSHPALGVANQHRINLKPHPGVFLGADLSAFPGAKLGPVKVPVNGPAGDFPAVETLQGSSHVLPSQLVTPLTS